MELKEVAVVSGKPGLYRIVKPAVNGVILEAMDGSKARFIVGTSTKVSVLGEISVYTENGDNIPLIDVFRTVFAKYGKKVELDPKDQDSKLRDFFTELLPEHDRQRVYNSDIRKIVTWYNILINNGFEDSFSGKEEEKKPAAVAEEAPLQAEEPKKEKKTTKKAAVAETEPAAELKEDKKATKPSARKGLTEQESSEKKAGLDPAPATEKKPAKTPARKTGK